MAITVEKLDSNGNPKDPVEIITLTPVQRVEEKASFEPLLADTSEQRDEDTYDPRFIYDYMKARRSFAVHERVHAEGGKTAEERAQDRIEFFTVKAYKDRFRFTWHSYNWIVVVKDARIAKAPAEDIYDFYLNLVGIR